MRHGLLLDSATGIVLAPVHPDVLLPPRIHPRRSPGVVVDKVRPSLGREPLLPPGWQLAGPGARSPRVHHCLRIRVLRRLLGLQCRGARTCPIFRQRPVLMPLSLNLCRLFLPRRIDRAARAGPVPTRCPRIMVNVVSAAQVVLPALPAGWQTTLCILEGTQRAISSLLSATIRGWLRCRRRGHAGRSVREIRGIPVGAAAGCPHG